MEESRVAEKETGFSVQKSLRHRTRPPCSRLYSGNGLSAADAGCSCLIHQHHYPPAIPDPIGSRTRPEPALVASLHIYISHSFSPSLSPWMRLSVSVLLVLFRFRNSFLVVTVGFVLDLTPARFRVYANGGVWMVQLKFCNVHLILISRLFVWIYCRLLLKAILLRTSHEYLRPSLRLKELIDLSYYKRLLLSEQNIFMRKIYYFLSCRFSRVNFNRNYVKIIFNNSIPQLIVIICSPYCYSFHQSVYCTISFSFYLLFILFNGTDLPRYSYDICEIQLSRIVLYLDGRVLRQTV